MANHMTEVAKMLGVELGERFKIIDDVGNESVYTYYFTDTDLMIDASNYSAEANDLYNLIAGYWFIKRKPWKPKYDEKYYSIGPGGVLEPGYWVNDFIDIAMYRLGNCYSTAEQAEANRDKWVEFYASDEVLEV